MSASVHTTIDELKTAGRLPSPTGVALAIIRLAEKDSTTVEEFVRVLATDPAMTGRVLKLANAASKGVVRPVLTLPEAVVRLGMRAVRNVALGFSLISWSPNKKCPAFDHATYWSHSLATAVAAQSLSTPISLLPAGEAFTCGLLARVGQLALATIYPAEYALLLKEAPNADAVMVSQLERERFAMDHNMVTAALFSEWGLPTLHAEAMRDHEDPDNGGLAVGSRGYQLAWLFRTAVALASVSVAPESQRPSLMPALLSSAARFDLDEGTLDQLQEKVLEEWRAWARILDVKTEPIPVLVPLPQSSREPLAFNGKVTLLTASGPPEIRGEIEENAGTLSVLVAMEDPQDRQLLHEALDKAGYKVLVACTGPEALRLLLETIPPLIVCDEQLAEMNGPALCRTVRQSEIGQQFHVTLLTSSMEEEHLLAILEAGADDYLLKPVSARLLLARLRAAQRLIRRQQQGQHIQEELRSTAAALAIAKRQMHEAAVTDILTGLFNRRYAMERLTQEWEAAETEKHELSCLLIDIDHFKRVNDTFGHDVGDLMLRETAATLTKGIRKSDIICRFGGEEILVLCPRCDPLAARDMAERLRLQVERNVVESPGFNGSVTVSIGVAGRRPSMKNPEELLKNADQALYAAKEGGRNQVRLPEAKVNTRRSFRVPVLSSSELRVTVTAADRRRRTAQALDISFTGLLLELSETEDPNWPVWTPLQLELRHKNEVVHIKTLVHRRPKRHYGLLFPDVVSNGNINPPETLRRMVAALERHWLQHRALAKSH